MKNTIKLNNYHDEINVEVYQEVRRGSIAD